MNFQQLEYIIAVNQLKNFSRAAEFCNVTQATLSAMVKKLEEELGISIFDRKSNPIMTTECGSDIIVEAKKVLFHAQQLKTVSKSAFNKIEGKLRVGVIPTVASSLLPIVIKPVLEKFPELQLEISELTTSNIVRLLKNGDIDAGILSTPISNTDLEEEILYYEMLMVYGNLDTSKKYLIPEEINRNNLWLLEEGHCLRDQVLQFCSLKSSDHTPGQLKFEANTFDTLLNMVDSYGGLTLLPELYVKKMNSDQQKKISPFSSPIPVREVSLVYFRPFAKLRLINALANEIRVLTADKLESSKYKKSELVITQA
ncbi:MAG: LysR family transcriptional regulator [Cytophagaceae bacterium]|nr:LysR family transcriptional regulator [Cytophagaceae bacterium]MBK9933454.1 LysR family transcriptional regulator [Cytophagaceae bacterium]MBL0302829.1 LysR family transcriptional regulator [Cytophagaceae bacterium]MBL0325656.1 LysR family transcriptional regulator [Cytophagaceae bacterium]